MGKTGGGRGTNQYQVQGVSQVGQQGPDVLDHLAKENSGFQSEHFDTAGCCECGERTHTCQDCPTFSEVQDTADATDVANPATTVFRFNTNYADTEQVRQLMPAYLRRYTELEVAGQYPYNDSFRGHLGVTGDEDTAIFLCQDARRRDEMSAKVSAALADGYVPVENVDAPIRCSSVVHYGFYSGGTGWREWKDARLVPGYRGDLAVLPKRARVHGTSLSGGKVLAKVAP